MRAHDVIHLFTKFRCAHAQCERQQNDRFCAGALLFFIAELNSPLYSHIPNFWPQSEWCSVAGFNGWCPQLPCHKLDLCKCEIYGNIRSDLFCRQLFLIVCQYEIVLPPNLPIIIISVVKHVPLGSRRTFFVCSFESIAYRKCLYKLSVLNQRYTWLNSYWNWINKPPATVCGRINWTHDWLSVCISLSSWTRWDYWNSICTMI